MAGNTQKFNSLRRQRELERGWDEMSSLGKIYVSSEVILYSIEDIRLRGDLMNNRQWHVQRQESGFDKSQ